MWTLVLTTYTVSAKVYIVHAEAYTVQQREDEAA
jgi:hypothetical protein